MTSTDLVVIELPKRITRALPEQVPFKDFGKLPQLYRNAKRGIGACLTIEHCNAFAKRAEGLEAFAKKVNDGGLQAMAFRVKVRALRKAGELLKRTKIQGKRPNKLIFGGEYKLGSIKTAVEIAKFSNRRTTTVMRLATIPKAEFERLIETYPPPELQVLENLGKRTSASKDRNKKLKKQSKGNTQLGIEKRYTIIYADPPWKYDHAPLGGDNRSIENQYPPMTLEEICALPIEKLATDDAVLFLWATAPKLEECMQVINEWGFTYRTCMVWVKDKIGMGYYVRGQHELLLIAKRGKLPVPEATTRQSSVVHAKRGKEHSEKPKIFYSILDKMYPDRSKVELFLRGEAPKGWDGWGNEAKATVEDIA